MRAWGLLPFLFSLLSSTSLGEDTVAEDISAHQLQRLAELLTSKQCEDLLSALSHPEENIFHQLERLSPEHNQLGLKPRVRRDASPAADREARCRTALTEWLSEYGEQTYYDRLSRALQHVGRTDIAVEVGKNINQDKVLSLKRYVEDYHKHVSALKFPSVQPDTHNHHQVRKVRDLTWRDLDLIIERAPVPPYQRGLLDGVRPLLYGFLLGFGGVVLMAASILLFIVHVSRSGRQKPSCLASATGRSSLRRRRLYSQSLMVGDVVSGKVTAKRSSEGQGFGNS